MAKLRNIERWKYLNKTNANLRALKRMGVTIEFDYPFNSFAHGYHFTQILFYIERDTNRLAYKEYYIDRILLRNLMVMGKSNFMYFIDTMKSAGVLAEIHCKKIRSIIVNPKLAYKGIRPKIDFIFKDAYYKQYGFHKFRKRGILKDEIQNKI